MLFLGSIVNAIAVLIGGTLGLLLKKRISDRLTKIYFQAIALFVIAIGISMVYKIDNLLIVGGSFISGSLIGEFLDLEGRIERLSEKLKNSLNSSNERFSQGIIISFLLFCTGSLTIIGAVQEGVDGSSDLLFTKSFMDAFSALLLASAFGIGVLFSAVPLLLFQGAITLLAFFAKDLFSLEIINGITVVSGIMLIGLGINILEIKRVRVVNMLPSLFVVVFLLWLSKQVGI